MKICFVQPITQYQVKKHRYAFSLTFPQLIVNMRLKENEYEVYYEGRTNIDFRSFIKSSNITHVFITSITSTFPGAIKFATIAKSEGIITVIGGIFASTSAKCIKQNYSCFDYIYVGKASEYFIDFLKDNPQNYCTLPYIYKSTVSDDFNESIVDIMLQKKFTDIFNYDETVCYEITQGCSYSCSFCTLRRAFGCQTQTRKIEQIKKDINKLKYWKKLKIIDDDIGQSLDILKHLSFHHFSEVIAEARLDRINDDFMRTLADHGITHLISGIETFDDSFLRKSQKTNSQLWSNQVYNAISLAKKYNIILRPVIMLNYPGFTIKSARRILQNVTNWTPKNNIELLLSFYTPHPGISLDGGKLLTNDLSLFDHLNMVYIPDSLNQESINELLEIYNQIVDVTCSREYNPYISITDAKIDSYDCFF